MNRFVRAAVVLLVTVAVAACSALRSDKDRRIAYKQAKSVPPLELPPDLVSGSDESLEAAPPPSAAVSARETAVREFTDARTGQAVLPTPRGARIARDGNTRWLVVEGEPEAVWPKVREFWMRQGFLIKWEDPRIGILETDWAENRADIPQDPIRKLLSKALDTIYSAPTRDQYRVRIERGVEPGTTEVYVSHRGMEEVVKGQSTIWQARPSDPELEAEMLTRMLVFLGGSEQEAEQQVAGAEAPAPRAHLVRTEEGTRLEIDEDFLRAWQRTGIALDRAGFAVEDRDRELGIYYVRYQRPGAQSSGGVMSKLAFWRDRSTESGRYQILLTDHDGKTWVRVLDEKGEREARDAAATILGVLEEELR